MPNRQVVISFWIIVILLISAFAGTVVYFNYELNSKNSEIASLNSQVSSFKSKLPNLTSQITNLTGLIDNITSAHLVTALGIAELGNYSSAYITYRYYRLYISGSVTNTGAGIAFDAGLKVVAYSADGTLEINMTVPLDGGGVNFGTDAATDAFITSSLNTPGSLQLGNLGSGHTATIALNIYHEGVVTSWTVTPVWWTYSR